MADKSKMTFKEKRAMLTEMYGVPRSVSQPNVNDAPVDDVDTPYSVNDIDNRKDLLARLNGFIGSIADREYLNPHHALNALQRKLVTVGLVVRMPDAFEYIEDGAIVYVPIQRFGGRKGVDVYGNWINDDGFADEAYFLELVFTLNRGHYSIDAQIVSEDEVNASEAEDVEFVDSDDETYTEDTK